MPDLSQQLAVIPARPLDLEYARTLAGELAIDCLPVATQPQSLTAPALCLVKDAFGLSLQQTGPRQPGPVRVDFLSGAVAHRRRFGGGAGQQIAKAVGVKGGRRPWVADLTAGLGRDSFVLATLGCRVTLVERSPVVARLLADGLARAAEDSEVAAIVATMELVAADAQAWLGRIDTSPEVIYLDPMFPHSDKSAQVKKEMRLFRGLVGDDADAPALLQKALEKARYRVVVKRPRKAPVIEGPEPSYRLEGKSGRFDIYPLKAMP